MRTSICFPSGYAPLALLTGRDFVTPSQVALNGEEEIDDLEEQIAQDDANEKTSANEDLEYEEIASTYRRICNPKLPFFIEDTEDWGPPKRTVARKRTPDDMDAFEAVRANAKAMRMDAAANAEKKWRRTKSTTTQSIANPRPRSDLGRKYSCVTASLPPACMGAWGAGIPALSSFCQSVKRAARSPTATMGKS